MTADERPEGLEDEHLEYLDELRESGVTNMFGAAPYLAAAYALDIKTARAYLGYWMRTFSERHAHADQHAPPRDTKRRRRSWRPIRPRKRSVHSTTCWPTCRAMPRY